jgi:hypothetical protein
MEVGVQNGGSLELWEKYFGNENCEIFGVDINPVCATLGVGRVFIGNQEDPALWAKIKLEVPPLDIFIDDGSHTFAAQKCTFDCMFPHVAPGGIYLVEDTHSSYMPPFGGDKPPLWPPKPIRTPKATFVEFTKHCIDRLHYSFNGLPRDYFACNCLGMHCYDSMVFFEKSWEEMKPPKNKFWKKECPVLDISNMIH